MKVYIYFMEEIFLEKLRRLRKEKGWTAAEAAKKLGFNSQAGYTKIELGNTEIKLSFLQKVSEVYNINISELLGLVNDEVQNEIKDLRIQNKELKDTLETLQELFFDDENEIEEHYNKIYRETNDLIAFIESKKDYTTFFEEYPISKLTYLKGLNSSLSVVLKKQKNQTIAAIIATVVRKYLDNKNK